MKLPYVCYALNYVLHLCTLYIRNGLSRAASLTMNEYIEVVDDALLSQSIQRENSFITQHATRHYVIT
jgi:hypothetical protein